MLAGSHRRLEAARNRGRSTGSDLDVALSNSVSSRRSRKSFSARRASSNSIEIFWLQIGDRAGVARHGVAMHPATQLPNW